MVKRKNKFLIIAFVMFAIIIILALSAPLNTQIIPTKLIAGENMGFDLGPGNLNFGQIVPGQGASRQISVENNFDKPISISIKSSGDISQYIIVSENNFVLQPNELKEISFSVFPPIGLEFGEYPGEIEIISKRSYF